MFKVTDGYEPSYDMPTIFESCEGCADTEDLCRNAEYVDGILSRAAYFASIDGRDDVASECREEYRMVEDWLDAIDYCDDNGIDPSDGAAFMSVLKMG